MPSLNNTTLSAAMTSSATQLVVASATYISAPTGGFKQKIYVIDPGSAKGELMTVEAVSGTTVTVSRLDEFKSDHASGSYVLIANVDPTVPGFATMDPTPGSSPTATVPWVNVTTGAQWLYSSVLKRWVPGFNNPNPKAPTVAVASANAPITPSGPLCHISGTTGPITGITRPVGFTGGSLTLIFDGATSWAAGSSSENIVASSAAVAPGGTVVAGTAYEFIWDEGTALWYVKP
jgi:hypothetical protein